MDRARPDDLLPERPAQRDIRDAVETDVIFRRGKQPLIDEQPLFIELIDRKCSRESEEVPLPVSPDNILMFHVISSSDMSGLTPAGLPASIGTEYRDRIPQYFAVVKSKLHFQCFG